MHRVCNLRHDVVCNTFPIGCICYHRRHLTSLTPWSLRPKSGLEAFCGSSPLPLMMCTLITSLPQSGRRAGSQQSCDSSGHDQCKAWSASCRQLQLRLQEHDQPGGSGALAETSVSRVAANMLPCMLSTWCMVNAYHVAAITRQHGDHSQTRARLEGSADAYANLCQGLNLLPYALSFCYHIDQTEGQTRYVQAAVSSLYTTSKAVKLGCPSCTSDSRLRLVKIPSSATEPPRLPGHHIVRHRYCQKNYVRGLQTATTQHTQLQ